MMELEFYKMEGAGNDFVVLDNRKLGLPLEEIIALSPQLCDRKFGIGADGLLALENSSLPDVDYTMIYRNADGSDAGMCGNGSRCLALFAAHNGFNKEQTFNVHEAIYKATVDIEQEQVSVSFPDVIAPKKLNINKKNYLQVYTGTEHIISFEDLDRLEIEDELVEEGRFIRNHPVLNPPGTNVNFVCPNEDDSMYVQTYERGVEDLTLACGTGAIASAIGTHFMQEYNTGEFSFEVIVKGGTLSVHFSFDEATNTYSNIKLNGPARFVYAGIINL
ncbi:MAG: diaminopimelate epimerase [Balneola sp.]|nr:MAG: diaminopimelate epimerase [Balneola sp.]